MFLHWRKIAIIVQQRVMMFDAEGADDDVGCLADRNAQFPQLAIISRGTRGEGRVQKRHDSVPAQAALDARSMDLVSGALENLKQNEVADQERLPARGRHEPGGRRRLMAPQMRNPDRAIDQNHDRRARRP